MERLSTNAKTFLLRILGIEGITMYPPVISV